MTLDLGLGENEQTCVWVECLVSSLLTVLWRCWASLPARGMGMSCSPALGSVGFGGWCRFEAHVVNTYTAGAALSWGTPSRSCK